MSEQAFFRPRLCIVCASLAAFYQRSTRERVRERESSVLVFRAREKKKTKLFLVNVHSAIQLHVIYNEDELTVVLSEESVERKINNFSVN